MVERYKFTAKHHVLRPGVELDREMCQLTVDGKTWKLGPRKVDFLCYLAENRGTVVPTRDILSDVWGPAYMEVNEDGAPQYAQYVRVMASELRRLIDAPDTARNDSLLLCVNGKGYKLRSFETDDGRPVFGPGSPHDVGEHLSQAVEEDEEVGERDLLAAAMVTAAKAFLHVMEGGEIDFGDEGEAA